MSGLVLALTSCGSATNRPLEETFERFHPIEPTANVSIKNGDGVVRVYGSSTNDVWVKAIKRAYTRDRLQQIAINVSVQSGSVSIETRFPPKPAWGLFDRSGTVEYTIVVPQTANISRLESGNGEVLVEGMRSQTLRAHLEMGRMLARNCFGNAVFSLGRGTLILNYDWWEPGEFSIQAKVENGNALAVLPGAAAFHLIAEAPRGKIANDFTARDRSNRDAIGKIDAVIGPAPSAEFSIRAAEGNIRVSRAYP